MTCSCVDAPGGWTIYSLAKLARKLQARVKELEEANEIENSLTNLLVHVFGTTEKTLDPLKTVDENARDACGIIDNLAKRVKKLEATQQPTITPGPPWDSEARAQGE